MLVKIANREDPDQTASSASESALFNSQLVSAATTGPTTRSQMPAALEPAEPPLAGRRGGVMAARWTCGGAEDATARSPAPSHARSLDWRVLLAVRTDRWRARTNFMF